ncbi:TPA: GAP family protein, partial [Synechococcus sp. WH 5701]|uniref:GAP family protein n=2 Tax=Synechococcus TaxID=1129 RepID=UPI003C490600
MTDATLWAELFAYGSGISLSPIHIGLLLLLLLGPDPLRRGGLFLLSWILTIATMIALMLTVGHGLLLTMEKGSDHRTGLDLIGAGALLALGIRDLLPTKAGGEEPAGWIRQLDRFCALPLPLLIGVSVAIELISPDDVVLMAKGASALLAAGLGRGQELLLAGFFTLAASLLLLLPVLGVALGRQRVLPLLQRGKQ